MAYLILSYNLKNGVTREEFEQWVRESDQPAMRGLISVQRFDTYRLTGLLMGEGQPARQYIEIFEISDMDAFTQKDMPGEIVQNIMAQFMGFAEAPEFAMADAV